MSNRNLAGDVGQQPIPAHIQDSRTRTHSIICIAYPNTHEIVDVAIECCFARSRQQYSSSMPQNSVTPHTPFSGHSASPSRQKEGRSPPAVFPPQPSFLFLSLSRTEDCGEPGRTTRHGCIHPLSLLTIYGIKTEPLLAHLGPQHISHPSHLPETSGLPPHRPTRMQITMMGELAVTGLHGGVVVEVLVVMAVRCWWWWWWWWCCCCMMNT